MQYKDALPSPEHGPHETDTGTGPQVAQCS